MKSRIVLPFRGELNLSAVLFMGQTFVWRRAEKGYLGSVEGVGVRVQVEGTHLFAEGDASEERLVSLLSRYFDTERDLPTLQAHLAHDPFVAEAIQRHRGLRVLRQPFWECLAGFVLSSVNNVRRITGVVTRLSQRFGRPYRLGNEEGFAFPTAEHVASASVETLMECGTGFRAKALKMAATSLVEGSLDEMSLRTGSYEAAKMRLMTLFGVGEKIADCVALYSLDYFEACPLDVWMRRELERLYFGGAKTPLTHLRKFVRQRFGAWAGYAQLYLYHNARTKGH